MLINYSNQHFRTGATFNVQALGKLHLLLKVLCNLECQMSMIEALEGLTD